MLRRAYAAYLLPTFFALLLLIAAVPASAQVDRGAIEGVVTDPTGARLSNAQVTLTNRDTGQSVRITTDDEGNYNASSYADRRSEEHTSELQSHLNLVCRLLL